MICAESARHQSKRMNQKKSGGKALEEARLGQRCVACICACMLLRYALNEGGAKLRRGGAELGRRVPAADSAAYRGPAAAGLPGGSGRHGRGAPAHLWVLRFADQGGRHRKLHSLQLCHLVPGVHYKCYRVPGDAMPRQARRRILSVPGTRRGKNH